MSSKNLSLSKILNSPSHLFNNYSSLEDFKIDIKRKLGIFSNNIKELKKRIGYIQDIFGDLEDTKNSEEIAKIFKQTIGTSIDELEKYLQEQEKVKEDMYLFEARFIEHIINIISAIIEFQKKLDALYPDLSKKIIDYLSDFLVGLLATQMPIVALAIKGSGILDALKSYISTEGLANTLNNWKEKLSKVQLKIGEVKEHKTLKKQFTLAKQVVELSEITGISAVSISELALESKSLEQIKKITSENPKSIDSLKKITELSESIPRSKDNITKTLTKLGAEIIRALEGISGIDGNLKNFIKHELSATKESLVQASMPNKNIIEKLEYCHKATKNIFNIYNKITETIKSVPNSDKVIEKISKLIKDQTKDIIPVSFLSNFVSLVPKLESLSKIIKIENTLKIAFENSKKRARSI